MAHRGGWVNPKDQSRENSWYAFSEAVSAGFRYLEVDVHTTADGALLVFHDDDLDRVTDGAGRISELTLRELESVRIGGRDPIPQLGDLLADFPSARFNIDLKDAAGAPLLAELIDHHDAADRVCVASFSSARLRAFRRLQPKVATATTPLGVAWACLGVGLRGWWPDSGLVMQIPVRYGGVPIDLVRADVVQAAHRAGRAVHVWTINDPDEMHRLIDLGVDGLVSDDLLTLKSVLIERGLWEGQ